MSVVLQGTQPTECENWFLSCRCVLGPPQPPQARVNLYGVGRIAWVPLSGPLGCPKIPWATQHSHSVQGPLKTITRASEVNKVCFCYQPPKSLAMDFGDGRSLSQGGTKQYDNDASWAIRFRAGCVPHRIPLKSQNTPIENPKCSSWSSWKCRSTCNGSSMCCNLGEPKLHRMQWQWILFRYPCEPKLHRIQWQYYHQGNGHTGSTNGHTGSANGGGRNKRQTEAQAKSRYHEGASDHKSRTSNATPQNNEHENGRWQLRLEIRVDLQENSAPSECAFVFSGRCTQKKDQTSIKQTVTWVNSTATQGGPRTHDGFT